MEETSTARVRGPIDFGIFACIAFFATMPLYSPNMMPLTALAADTAFVGRFVLAMLTGVALVSGAFIIVLLARIKSKAIGISRRTIAARVGARPFAIVAAASGVYVVSLLTFYGMAAGVVARTVGGVQAVGFASGICCAFLLIEWGRYFARYDVRQALLAACLMLGTCALINWALSFLPAIPLITINGLMLVSGAGFPALNLARRQSAPSQSPPAIEVEPINPKGLLTRFSSVLMPALIGMALFAFFMGVSPIKVFGLVHAEVLGTLVASAALVPVCLLKPKQPLIHFLYETLLPVAAVAIMLLIAVPLPWLKTSGVLLIGIYVFFSAAALLALALGIGSAHSGEFPSDLVFAALAFAFAVLTLVGLAFGSGLSESMPEHTAPPFIVALYCAYLLLTPVLKHARTGLGDSSAEDAAATGGEEAAGSTSGPAPADVVEARCDELAAAYKLSPREREIVAYLGRGHTSAFVAKTLVISENTAYTHARNIYRKLGVKSKEELIQLINE